MLPVYPPLKITTLDSSADVLQETRARTVAKDSLFLSNDFYLIWVVDCKLKLCATKELEIF